MTRKPMTAKKRQVLKLTLYQSDLAHEMFTVEMQKNKLLGRLVFRCLQCGKKVSTPDSFCSLTCGEKVSRNIIHDESPDVRIVRYIDSKKRDKSYFVSIGEKGHLFEIKKLSDLDRFVMKRI